MDSKREFLRHTLATLAYRGAKAVSSAPAGFANTRVCATSRSAIEILAHIGDLLDWAVWQTKGKEVWNPAAPQVWDAEVQRFFQGLKRFDEILATETPLGCSPEKLFQGPIADALTHVGQLATLRRLANAPVRGENYLKAEITIGRIGPDQSTRRVEFD
jgi:hypothetical protein